MHMQETGLGEKGVALFQVVSGMCVCPSVGKCLRVVVTKGVTHLRVVVIKVVIHLRVVVTKGVTHLRVVVIKVVTHLRVVAC
jgi:hypothetical protein